MIYWLTVLAFAGVYASLAISYNMVAGYVGMLSMAHAVFFGIGAYTYAIIGTKISTSGESFLPAVLVGMVLAVVVACLLGALFLWLPPEYVIVVTLSVQVALTSVLLALGDLTGGAYGIPGIPMPTVAGFVFGDAYTNLLLVGILVAVTLAVAVFVRRPPLGLAARASRDDPVAAAACGIRPRAVLLYYFALAGALAAAAGAVFAGISVYVDPHSFTIDVSILVLSMVAIGGLGNPYGALIGGFAIALLPQLLDQMHLSSGVAAPLQQILYGLALVLVVIVRPAGLFPERQVERTGKAVQA